MASHPDSKIDCSQVYVKKSSYSNEETGDFDGAFAFVPIKKGWWTQHMFLVMRVLNVNGAFLFACTTISSRWSINDAHMFLFFLSFPPFNILYSCLLVNFTRQAILSKKVL